MSSRSSEYKPEQAAKTILQAYWAYIHERGMYRSMGLSETGVFCMIYDVNSATPEELLPDIKAWRDIFDTAIKNIEQKEKDGKN